MRFPVRTRPSGPNGPSPDRLNTLIDAVFAFAMTILVLDLRIPPGLPDQALTETAIALLPRVGAFALSFAVIAQTWVYVHQRSTIYTRVTLGHMALTLLSLMLVAALPFTTATMGAYPTHTLGPLLYAGNAFALVLVYTIDFLTNRACIAPQVDRGLLKQFSIAHVISTAALGAGCLLAFVDPRLAIGAVALHVLGHWSVLWWFEGDMIAAQTAIRASREVPAG